MTQHGSSSIRGARAGDDRASAALKVYAETEVSLPRVETGIPGFDHVTAGGLTKGRATLVSGPAGAAKTTFAAQFLAEGVRRGEPAVFVTLEEPASDLRENLCTLGWDIPAWERDELWAFVDGSPAFVDDEAVAEAYSFDALLAQIGHAVDRTGAVRVAVDSLTAIRARYPDDSVVRQHLRRLAMNLRRMGLTVVFTAEVSLEGGQTPYELETYVADNVVVLRNTLDSERRRRTVEVLKMRGAMHRKGEYPFSVLPGQGVVVIPLSLAQLDAESSERRVTSGNPGLDDLCGGGLFGDSIVLVSGPTGTGKTLLATEFLSGGAAAGERCVLFAFEESRAQLLRNARGWGRDFAEYERQGTLRIIASYPEVASLEDHLVVIRDVLEEFKPTRIAVDSLSALERGGSPKAFREFIIGLTAFLKAEQVTAVLTATTSHLLGGSSITEGHVSTLTDSIVLLRYVELRGEMRRAVTVLKMRGSAHDQLIREFRIDDRGMHVGDPLREVSGILSGRTVEAVTQSDG